MLKKKWRITLGLIALLAIVFFLGPKPKAPVVTGTLPAIPTDISQLDQFVHQQEQQHRLKPENEARIVWADSLHRKTPVSIVYLHGFTASAMEGDPVHRDIARRFGANLYLARLDQHGIDTTDALVNMTASGLIRDAREALAIGKALGEKVILVGTSTGGTLALTLAAQYPKDVYAVINMSPNIAINEPFIEMVDVPWGLYISRLVRGGKYVESAPKHPGEDRYWFHKYRLEAVVELQNLIDHTMLPKTFKAIRQPVLSLYYYKNEKEQDPTVKVSAILEMNEELGTPAGLKKAVAIPKAGAHVLGSGITSGDVPGVEREITSFLKDVLHLPEAGTPAKPLTPSLI